MKTGIVGKHSYVELKRPSCIQFGLLNQEEILRQSVANLTSERIYDEETFLPQRNAVNDPRMGVTNKDLLCHTCNGD